MGRLLLWDLDNQGAPPQTLQVPDDGYFFALAFHPDGKTFAAATRSGSVLMWDLERLSDPPAVLGELEGGAWSLAFSPNGRHIAVGAKFDDSVRLFDLADPELGATIGSPGTPVDGVVALGQRGGVPVAFSPDGKTLASGSHGGSVSLWDVDAPMNAVQVFQGHEGPVWSLAFSPNGGRLAACV